MNIDEAIADERRMAEERKNHIGEWNEDFSSYCKRIAEEHEQLAEWLEELKAYREIGTIEECKNSVLEILRAYNKAIDDFIEKSNNMKFADKDAKEMFVERVQEIAEQLKAGVENE